VRGLPGPEMWADVSTRRPRRRLRVWQHSLAGPLTCRAARASRSLATQSPRPEGPRQHSLGQRLRTPGQPERRALKGHHKRPSRGTSLALASLLRPFRAMRSMRPTILGRCPRLCCSGLSGRTRCRTPEGNGTHGAIPHGTAQARDPATIARCPGILSPPRLHRRPPPAIVRSRRGRQAEGKACPLRVGRPVFR